MHRMTSVLLFLFFGSLARAETFVIGAQNIEYYPHYDFSSDVDKGYAWALLEAFSNASGHDFVYLDMPIRRLQMELRKGNVDFVYPDNPIWYNQIVPASKKTFSVPLTRALGGAIVKVADVGQGIDSVRRLAMPLGFTPVKWQTRLDENKTTLTTVTDTSSALKLLHHDRVDAMNLEYHVARYLASTIPNLAAITLDTSLPHTDVAFSLATIRHQDMIAQLDRFIAQNQPLITSLKARYGLREPKQILAELMSGQQED